MDTMGPLSNRMQKVSPRVSTALASAILEWMLIVMLFIDAGLSFLIRKLATYWELQIPCLLCSRLDHVFGNEKVGYYWDLICGDHKLEISSLVLCHAHSKLVDVRGICETCLFSFATINKSNAETYRLLVGKLGDDLQDRLDQEPLLGNQNNGGKRNCSCCNMQWISGHYAQQLLKPEPIGDEAAEVGTPMSLTGKQNKDYWNMDGSSLSIGALPVKKNGFDQSPHIEYKMVKITSDTESETPYSDDEITTALIHRRDDPDNADAIQLVQSEPHTITPVDDIISDQIIYAASVPEHSLVKSEPLEVIDADKGTASATTVGHGLEKLNWQQVEHNVDVSAPSDPMPFDEVPPSSILHEPLGEPLHAAVAAGEKENLPTRTAEISAVGIEIIPAKETGMESHPISGETIPLTPRYLDLGDAYKLAVSNRGGQLSGKFSEQISSARVSEDFKLLLSQLSASRGIELSSSDISPRISGNNDELKASDASSSIGMQILQKRISLERNESIVSLDGSTVSEIEGEHLVDRLKRQVEHDKKLMGVLYKELEEERNASAVAANQAMAMITKLQEEKATLHMEALQCLRMMEEQAEYDSETLQKVNDLLAEKEKEIQDLEAELELYKEKIGDISMQGSIKEPASDSKAEIRGEYLGWSCLSNEPGVCGDPSTELLVNKNVIASNGSSTEFEDARLYILKCLEDLEKRLFLFSNNGNFQDVVNGEDVADGGTRDNDLKERSFSDQHSSKTNEDDIKKFNVPKGIFHSRGFISSNDNSSLMSKESIAVDSGGPNISVACDEAILNAMKCEFSESIRLGRLELDFSNSLRNGDEWLKFIQEIAYHLQELRSAVNKKWE